jgi:hypothetical protein
MDGRQSDYSNEEDAMVRFLGPYGNMVLNGDFSREKDSWTWEVGDSASAEWMIEDGTSHFGIAGGGNQVSDVQLRQAGMQLGRGEEYVLEFEARADQPRIIEVKVGQNKSPWTDYSKIGFLYLRTRRTRFRYTFVMENASDYDARVVFNMGNHNADVYLDNVSLLRKGYP